MPITTIAQFAVELSKPAGTLLEQLAAAGVKKNSVNDPLSENDKERLLDHLRKSHGTSSGERKKITLVKKSSVSGDAPPAGGRSRTITVQVKKKSADAAAPPVAPVAPIESTQVASFIQEAGPTEKPAVHPPAPSKSHDGAQGSRDTSAAPQPSPDDKDRRRIASEEESARIRAMLATSKKAQPSNEKTNPRVGAPAVAAGMLSSAGPAHLDDPGESASADQPRHGVEGAWKPEQADQDWARLTARRIVLRQLAAREGTADKAAARAREWWSLAEGKTGTVPNGAGRSTVNRISDGNGAFFFRKRFSQSDSRWEDNESFNLHYIGRADGDKRQGLRQHVGWLRGTYAHEGSRLDSMETLDCGPNLEAWLSWCPTSVVADWPLPIFAQPEFLAAITRQALIGLEKLWEFGVVHNDVYDRNLCLEMPPKVTISHPFQSARIALASLTVRFIDFETAFNPKTIRVPRRPDDRASPYAKACFTKALDHSDEHAAPYLGGIDFGSDLWALAQCLRDWYQLARGFYGAWLSAVAEKYGPAHPATVGAEETALAQGRQLAMIDDFVLTLEAQEREPELADHTTVSKRKAPHAMLRVQLESQFRAIIATGAYGHREIRFIDPADPI